ncbi:MAG: glycosyltransferase family 2 protein [Ruminococcaceae bacterium]|nr:glycosyltransferase family 2 protein [Oscillospiraceae bacterium]
MDKMLSVVIPSYNEQEMIQKTAAVIHTILTHAAIDHELIFVDDGSKDNTWQEIEAAAAANSVVHGVHFSRNFGKEAAIFAGLQAARGACAVVIDCDLQHPPEKMLEMYALWEQGYEVVEAIKSDRGKESALHKAFATVFYGIISVATKINMRDASDFKLLDRKAIDALLTIKEKNSFFRALSSWIGFKCVQITFDVQERTAGVSKWSFWSLVKYAVTNITSFSDFPMKIITALGMVSFVISVVMGAIALIGKISGRALEGFTTVIILQILFSSIIITSIGIIGYYLGKIYDEIKGRPKYIVSKTCGKDEE